MRRRIWRLARVPIAAGVLLAVLAGSGLVVLARTEWGRAHLLARLVPLIEQSLTGRLRVGRLEGGLFDGLVLHDLALEDGSGRVAVAARRIEARYSLRRLPGAIEIEELRGEGVVIDARHLEGGVLNLAALVRPSPPSPPSLEPLRIEIGRVQLEASIAYQLPPSPSPSSPPFDRAALDLRLLGGGVIEGDHITIRVESLDLTTTHPVAASLHTGGGIVLGLGGDAVDGFHCSVSSDGEALQRFLPASAGRLLGHWQVDLTARGPLHALEVAVVARPPVGKIELQGRADLLAGSFRGTVDGDQIDPGAALSLAPHAAVDFAATTTATVGAANVILSLLKIKAAGLEVAAHGHASGAGLGELWLNAEAPDLRRLNALLAPTGVRLPRLAGAVSLQTHATRTSEAIHVTAAARGTALALPGVRIGGLDLKLDADDHFAGQLHTTARHLVAGGVTLENLAVDATSERGQIALRTALVGPAKTRLALVAHGTPQWHAGAPTGIDATLDSLRGGFAGTELRSEQPARIRVGDEVRIEGFSLLTGSQHLRLDGRYHLARQVADAVAKFEGIDARELARIAGVAGPVPATRFDGSVHVVGSVRDPVVDLSLRGTSEADQSIALDRFRHILTAHYAGGRATADLATTGDAGRLALQLEVPLAQLAPAAAAKPGAVVPPLAVTLRGELFGIERLQKMLPPALASLRGPATLDITLGGALARPELHAVVRGPAFRFAQAGGSSVEVTLDYHPGAVTVRGDVRLIAGADHGAAAAGGFNLLLSAPLDLNPLALPADLVPQLRHGLALSGRLAFDQLDLAAIRSDLAALGIDLAAANGLRGHAVGAIDLSGTADAPNANLTLDLSQLGIAELALGDLGLRGDAGWDGQQLTAKADLHQAGGGTISLTAALPEATSAKWQAALRTRKLDLGFLAAAVPEVKRVEAKLDSEIDLDGTRAQPRLGGAAHIEKGLLELDTDPLPYRDITLDAAIKDGKFTLRRFAVAHQKGTFAAWFSSQLDGLRPRSLDGGMEARRFPIAVGEMVLTLDSRVKLHGETRREQEHERMIAAITLEEGTVHLPKFEGRKAAQSLAPLADVVFVDHAALAARAASAASVAPSSSKEGAVAPPPFELQLAAHIPGPFYVRGPEVNSELQGDVEVSVIGDKVRVTGLMETLRGIIQISDRPYTVTRARASLDGSPNPDPTLDVQLTRQVEGALLIIELDGTARAPRITLRSEPPIYDQTKVITMIASGEDSPGAPSDKPLGDQVEQKVIGAVSSLLLGKIKEELGSYLPVEVLKLELGYQGYSTVPTARLEIGKYLLDNLYLGYIYQYSPTTSQRKRNSHEAHLEYSFRRDFHLVTTFGDAAVGSVDFYWNHRF